MSRAARLPQSPLQTSVQRLGVKLGVAEYLGKQATADRFSGMHRNDSRAAIGVLKIVMTALDTDYVKAKALQSGDKLLTSNAWQSCHRDTLTR